MSLSKLRKNESEYQNLVNEEKRFLNEIKTNKQNLKALKTKIGKMDIIDVEKSINEIQKEMRENSLNFKMKKDEKEEEIKKLEKEKTEFESVLKHLKLYSSLEIERKQIKRLFEKNKKKKSSLEQVLKTEEKSILEIRESLKEKEQKVKNFEQNAKFRETEKEYLKIVKERNDLKSKVERSFGENELFSKYEEAKKKIGDLKKMFFESDGRKSAFKDQAIEISNTIKNNESFEMIEDHFKDTLINLETNLVANKDLDLYQKALDNALIEFHSIKMKEINAILKKYWKLVYKGNDIDFIEIVSNCDENTVQRTSNRNYNYFVLMVCGDAKLEMKGRCSAGQKVLASLLIRLSLAGSFPKPKNFC
ncbi:DNA repair protein rad50 [Bonamia ostreae]|uniref:DNA repair protein rad50 n=1 Tax=Bonamia ostreae TaxID=126728 RepID=A0ABV2AHG8_9EUKA